MGEQDGKYFGGQLDLFHSFIELFFYFSRTHFEFSDSEDTSCQKWSSFLIFRRMT